MNKQEAYSVKGVIYIEAPKTSYNPKEKRYYMISNSGDLYGMKFAEITSELCYEIACKVFKEANT